MILTHNNDLPKKLNYFQCTLKYNKVEHFFFLLYIYLRIKDFYDFKKYTEKSFIPLELNRIFIYPF